MRKETANSKLIFFVAVIFFFVAAYERGYAFKTGAPLTIGYTAEHIGLSAVTAYSGGINSVLYNPAAVINDERGRNLLSAYNMLPENVNSYLLAYSNGFKNGGINEHTRLTFFIAGLDGGDIQQTLIDGRDYVFSGVSKKYAAAQIGVSAAFKNADFHYGFSLKNYSEEIAGYKDNVFLFDGGLLLKNFFAYGLDVGVSALNIGSTIKFNNTSEKLSQVYSAGLCYDFFRFDLLLDLKKIGNLSPRLNTGVNFRFDNNLHFMIGYNGIKNLNKSVTIGFSYLREDYGVQYAYDNYAELGGLHYITVSFAFKPMMFDNKIQDDKYSLPAAITEKEKLQIQPTEKEPVRQEFKRLDLTVLQTQAVNALKERKFELAISVLHQLIESQPENIEYLKMLGDAYFGNKDFPNAIKYYEQVQKIGEHWLK